MVFCLSVTLWNYKVCDNRNSMKQCNFGTNIQVSLWTPWIFFRGKFIPKIGIFGDFGWRKATFLKPQW